VATPTVPCSPLAAPFLTSRPLQEKLHAFRVAITKQVVGKPKGGKTAAPSAAAPKPAAVHILVASQYAPWQRAPMAVLGPLYDPVAHASSGGFPADALARVKDAAAADPSLKPLTKRIMVRTGPAPARRTISLVVAAVGRPASGAALPALCGRRRW
jgi:hypothetical protein